MRRFLFVALLAAATALLPAAAAADDGHGGGRGDRFGPFDSASPDSGTCGNDWAADTFKREFFVQQTGPGTWRVTEAFVDGRFTTLVGLSPGACETTSSHGSLLLPPPKVGSFGGFLTGTVSGGTFNAHGCDVPAPCTTTSGFIAAVFGPTALYTCTTGVGACSFYFDYRAHDQGLAYRHWVNASADLGGNRGDIASV
jgi:hypothetical protein